MLINCVVGVPVPQRYRGGRGRGRGRGGWRHVVLSQLLTFHFHLCTGYYRPPPPANNNNYFNTVLPLKVAGGVGLAAGFGLSQVLNGK